MRAVEENGEYGSRPNAGRVLTTNPQSSSDVDFKEEKDIRKIEITHSQRKLGVFQENSGSAGVTSLNVDYDDQLKHIYSQANNEKSNGQNSSHELSNTPIRRVRVETNSKRGPTTQQILKKNAANMTTKAPIDEVDEVTRSKQSKERTSTMMKRNQERRPQELKKLAN